MTEQPAASTGFGAPSTGGLFGQSNPTTTSFGGTGMTFGAGTNTGFGGAAAPSAFGAQGTTAFGAQGGLPPNNGTGNPPYQTTKDTEPAGITHFIAISAMPQYKAYSWEELRLQDYQMGKKFSQTTGPGFGGAFGSMGQTTSNTFGGGGFGAAAAAPTTGFGATSNFSFNSQPTGGGLFGGGNAAAPAANAFGATTNTFGANTTGGVFGGGGGAFGQPQQQTTSTFGSGGFGAAAAKPAFTFGGSNTTGAFGGGTTNAFGAASNPTGAFGARPNNTSPFGQQQTQQPSAFGASNVFGKPPTTGGGLFGSTPAAPSLFGNTQPTTTAPSLFGGGTSGGFGGTNTGTSLFGGGQTATTGFGGGTGFGGLGANTANKPTTGLFGNTGGMGGGGFGTGGNLFGGNTQQPTSSFGTGLTNTNTSFGGLGTGGGFGGGGLFGNTQGTGNAFGASQQQPPLTASIDKQPYGLNPLFANTPAKTAAASTSGPQVFSIAATEPKKPALLPHFKLTPKSASKIKLRGFTPSPMVRDSHSLPLRDATPKDGLLNLLKPESDDPLSRGFPESFKPRAKKLILNNSDTPAHGAVIRSTTPTETPGSTQKSVRFHHDGEVDAVVDVTADGDDRSAPGSAVSAGSRVSELNSSPGSAKKSPSNAPTSTSPKRLSYKMYPSLERLLQMSDEELTRVRDFTVSMEGMGKVKFLEPVDLLQASPTGTREGIRMIPGTVIIFTKRMCTVYPDDAKKDPMGAGVNVRAEVTLMNCQCIDKATGVAITRENDARLDKYYKKLENMAGTKMLGFKPESGEWKFEVQHFSRYGIEDDEEASNYKMEPELQDLLLKSDAELRSVENFVVSVDGVGKIRYLEPVDLLQASPTKTRDGIARITESIIRIKRKSVEVYPDGSEVDAPGHGVNIPAELTLESCYCRDRITREVIVDSEDKRLRGFRSKLECMPQTEFIDFEPADGRWRFQVQHFSRYGLDSDDDDEEYEVDDATAKHVSFASDGEDLEEESTFHNDSFANIGVRKGPVQRVRDLRKVAVMNRMAAVQTTDNLLDELHEGDEEFEPAVETEADDDEEAMQEEFEVSPEEGEAMNRSYEMDEETFERSSPDLEISRGGHGRIVQTQTHRERDQPPTEPFLQRPVSSRRSQVMRASLFVDADIREPQSRDNEKSRHEKLLNVLYQNSRVIRTKSANEVKAQPNLELEAEASDLVPMVIVNKSACFSTFLPCQAHTPSITKTSSSMFTRSAPEPASVFSHRETLIWKLASALFDPLNIPMPIDGLSQPVVDEIHAGLRKEAVSSWLQDSYKSSEATGSMGDKIFSLLLMRQVGAAVKTAIEGKNLHLATLITQVNGAGARVKAFHRAEGSFVTTSRHGVDVGAAASGHGVAGRSAMTERTREDLCEQIKAWSSVPGLMKGDLIKVWNLLAGDPDLWGPETLQQIPDWQRTWGLFLWYANGGGYTVGESLSAYDSTWAKSNPIAKSPVPPYAQKQGKDVSKTILDMSYHLLKLSFDPNHLLEAALEPENVSSAKMDCRISWLIWVLLARGKALREFSDAQKAVDVQHAGAYTLGDTNATSKTKIVPSSIADSMTASLCENLAVLGLWRWACFVAMFLSHRSGRESLVRNLLARYFPYEDEGGSCVKDVVAGIYADPNLNTKMELVRSDGMEKVLLEDCDDYTFIVHRLKIPARWVHEAKKVIDWELGGGLILQFIVCDLALPGLIEAGDPSLSRLIAPIPSFGEDMGDGSNEAAQSAQNDAIKVGQAAKKQIREKWAPHMINVLNGLVKVRSLGGVMLGNGRLDDPAPRGIGLGGMGPTRAQNKGGRWRRPEINPKVCVAEMALRILSYFDECSRIGVGCVM
ncbi:hypothetical protein HK101_006032, partial [Irineochytrium annulatum]